jgi:hypothetical protein
LGLGAAAEWVTIVLFAEVMRRSLQPLRRQEIYILFYIAASLTAMGAYGLSGGPLQWKIWDQFFVQSSPAAPIADQVPRWAVPAPDSPALRERTFLDSAWALPIFLLVLTEILGRASWMSMGYLLFRMTSDVEKLPFPLAPVAASGALALAEVGSREESWRWGVFSTGAVVGMGFGLFYVGIPVFTGTLFGNALQLIPIPFLDLTQNVEASLPTAIVGVSINLGEVLVGFVLPYHILLGAAISSVATYVVANPILYHAGLIPNWQPNSPALQTKLAADLDFWLAIIVGLQLAVAVIGVSMVVRTLREYRTNQSLRLRGLTPPPGRGDPPLWIPLAVWAVSVVSYIALCRWLVPDFPLWIVAGFGLALESAQQLCVGAHDWADGAGCVRAVYQGGGDYQQSLPARGHLVRAAAAVRPWLGSPTLPRSGTDRHEVHQYPEGRAGDVARDFPGELHLLGVFLEGEPDSVAAVPVRAEDVALLRADGSRVEAD